MYIIFHLTQWIRKRVFKKILYKREIDRKESVQNFSKRTKKLEFSKNYQNREKGIQNESTCESIQKVSKRENNRNKEIENSPDKSFQKSSKENKLWCLVYSNSKIAIFWIHFIYPLIIILHLNRLWSWLYENVNLKRDQLKSTIIGRTLLKAIIFQNLYSFICWLLCCESESTKL